MQPQLVPLTEISQLNQRIDGTTHRRAGRGHHGQTRPLLRAELLKALLAAFPQTPAAARPITFVGGQLSFCARPFVGEYMQTHGFGEIREGLAAQEAEFRAQQNGPDQKAASSAAAVRA